VATSDARDAIVKEASLLADEVGDTSKHYLRVMEKVVSGTEAYLEKEAKR
jgi:protein disulfide-isomerase A6